MISGAWPDAHRAVAYRRAGLQLLDWTVDAMERVGVSEAVAPLAFRYGLLLANGNPGEQDIFAGFLSDLIADGAFDPIDHAAGATRRRPKYLDRTEFVRHVESFARKFAATYTPGIAVGLPLFPIDRTAFQLVFQVGIDAHHGREITAKRRETLTAAIKRALGGPYPWSRIYMGILVELQDAEFSVIGVAQRQKLKCLAEKYTDANRDGVADALAFVSEFAADLITSGVLEPHFRADVRGVRTKGVTPLDRHQLLRTAERVTRWFAETYVPQLPVPGFADPITRFVEHTLQDPDQFGDLCDSRIRGEIAEAIATTLSGGAVEAALSGIDQAERDHAIVDALWRSPLNRTDGIPYPAVRLDDQGVWLEFLVAFREHTRRAGRCLPALVFATGAVVEPAEATAPVRAMANRLVQWCEDDRNRELIVNLVLGMDDYLLGHLAWELATSASATG